jgi:hypothetical protein
MLGFGFPKRKPRPFNYKPLYYDPEKEAREQRKKEILGANYQPAEGQGSERPGDYIRKSVMARRGVMQPKRRKGASLGMSIVFLVVLLALTYWALT